MTRCQGFGRFMVLALLVLGIGVPAVAWGQAAGPGEAASGGPTPSDVIAGSGSVLGSIVVLPFKALVLCPGTALASGATYAFSGGQTETAEHLLRVGCTGSYWATPGMVQGEQEFLGGGRESAFRGR